MSELIDPSNYQDFTLQTIMTPDGITRVNNILRQLSQNIAGDTESVRVFSGVGTPEASVAAGVGSLYMRTDGGADTSVYRKESGSGNTGWVAVKSPASLPLSTANGGLGGDASGWTVGDFLYLSATGTIGHTPACKMFTSSGTFTAPTGITKVVLTMVGAGAGGGPGGSGTDGGGGGAGVGLINYPFTVVSGNSYTVTIGTGGASNTDGGATSFDTVSVAGGSKGLSGSAASNGGAGAGNMPTNTTATVGTSAALVTLPGQNGYKAAGGGVGGYGGSSMFGVGGTPVNGVVGGNGSGYGAGGAGGSQTSTTAGGVGSNGFVLVQIVS